MINWRKPFIYILSFLQGSKRMIYFKKIIEYSELPLENKKALQDEKLKTLLLHAYENVPYYRQIFREKKIVVDNKVRLDKFKDIPLLTKDVLRERFKYLKSEDIGKRNSYENHSGGSTGEPTKFIQDNDYDDWNVANKLYYKHFGGQSIGEKELRLWGSEKDFLGDKENWKTRLRNFIFNRKDLNAFCMTEENMFRYVQEINTFKPVWIEAYVQPMYELALFIEKNKLKVYSPRGVLTSAGTLYPDMRDKIGEVFQCEVWNRYGSREVGDIAFGKEELGISFWNNKIEILESGSDLGKIVVTNLNNYSFPIIRFDIGDIGKLGTEWGKLDKVEGREMSVVRTKEGKIIPGEFFIHFLGVVMNTGAIRKFQVIQKDFDMFKIKVVVEDKHSFEEERRNIENLFNEAMEYECKYEWEFVKNIKSLKSGKYLYIRSDIKL